MTPRLVLSSTLAAAMLLGSVSALAATASSLLPVVENPCETRTGRDRGRCIGDYLKSWARTHKNWHEEEDAKHNAWHAEHDRDGLTPEFFGAHNALHDERTRIHKEYHALQVQMRREFQQEQDAYRRNQTPTSRGFVKKVTKGQAKDAAAKCKNVTDDRMHRICQKQALQLLDPDAKPWFKR